MILRRPMKARENKKSEKEEKELESKEKQCNNCLLQRKLWHLEPVQLKETRLKKHARKNLQTSARVSKRDNRIIFMVVHW